MQRPRTGMSRTGICYTGISYTGMSRTGMSRTGIVSPAGTFLAPGGAGPPRLPRDIWQFPRTAKKTCTETSPQAGAAQHRHPPAVI